jgi:hypothetical protein
MKKSGRIVLTAPPVSFAQVAKRLGISKRQQQEIKLAVARTLSGEAASAASKSVKRASPRPSTRKASHG